MGLDALLTNKESDLRLRFALRGALVVSLDLAGFKGVFDDLYEAYKQRNDMAHGGDPPETITLGGGRYQSENWLTASRLICAPSSAHISPVRERRSTTCWRSSTR